MKRLLKKVLFFAPLLLTGLSAGSVVMDFLSAADSDIDAKYRGIASLYEEDVPQFNYIDKARVSVRHSHFSDVEREYALRLYTKSLSDLQNETKSYALEKRLALSDGDIALLNIRRQRYEMLLELLYRYSELQLLDDKKRFEKEALHSMRYFAQSESDITGVYKRKEALRDIELAQSKLQMEYNALLTEIAQTVNKKNEAVEKELNLSLFLPAYTLLDYIVADLDKNVSAAGVDENPIVVKSFERVNLARQRVKSEQDKSSVRLDYVGLKYDDSKKSKNAFAVDVAVEIPLSRDRRKIVREKVKLLKDRQKAEENRKKIVQKVSRLHHEVKDMMTYFYTLDSQIKETRPKKSNYYAFKLYESMKKRDLRLRKERLKVAWKTAQKYVAWLYWSNRLHETDFSKLLQRTQSGK